MRLENKLVLKDGTEILDGFASKSSNNQLMVRIPGNEIVETTIEFSDPNKTEEIVCYFSVYKNTYIGYTDIFSIQYFADENYVEVWLKGENTSTKQEFTVPKEYLPEQMRGDS